MQRYDCANTNHWRLNVSIRFCPSCGKIVNGNIPIKTCREQDHAALRSQRYAYCMDCGEQLIQRK